MEQIGVDVLHSYSGGTWFEYRSSHWLFMVLLSTSDKCRENTSTRLWKEPSISFPIRLSSYRSMLSCLDTEDVTEYSTDTYIQQPLFERDACMSSVVSSSHFWAVRGMNCVYVLECVYPMGKAVSLSSKRHFYVKIFIMRFLLRKYIGETCKLAQS
jgi:hypothetical protein